MLSVIRAGSRMMEPKRLNIDLHLAKALRERRARWPEEWGRGDVASEVAQRALYHGVSGLLIERCGGLAEWPEVVRNDVRKAAIAQAMWEMRHQVVVANLLADLAHDGVLAIILKGTALAYDLYEIPANRARGDTDILVDRADLARTRARLAKAGFRFDAASAGVPDSLRLQEVWVLAADRGHEIDLHWSAVNSHALNRTLTFADCSASLHNLPALGDGALAMDRVTALVHACIHRAQHVVSPYIVSGTAYYGGDRLIWSYDIHLLGGTLTAEDWTGLCNMALNKGVAEICLDGLLAAQEAFGELVPAQVTETLRRAPGGSRAAKYLFGSGKMGRAWMDLGAVEGWRDKLAYLAHRAVPSPAFMRAKYPDWANRGVARLYFRRIAELWHHRSEAGGR